jgi:hypothetical protein
MKQERKKRHLHLHVVGFLAGVAGISAVVMLLWNAIVPDITGWTKINYWQAAGLLILIRLLFSGFGRFAHGMGRHRHWRRHHAHDDDFHRRMSHDERMAHIRKHLFGDDRPAHSPQDDES